MQITRRFFSAVIVLILALTLSACGSDKKVTLSDPVQGQSIEDYIASQAFSGAVLVAKDGKILLKRGFDLADRAQNIQNHADTTFLIASVSKQFTAMAMLILQERGQLSLEDPLSHYLPDFPSADKITLKNLLNMNSGIVNYTSLKNFAELQFKQLTPSQLIDQFSGYELEFEPGTRYQYSNSNYVLAGFIIEQVSGVAYADFIEQEIFRPLGMSNSGYGYDAPNQQFALGYGDGKPAPILNMSVPYASGALASTVEDLFIWHNALRQRWLISDQSAEQMYTPALAGYALGWNISYNVNGDQFHQHGGGIEGFSTYILRSESIDYVVVVLSNEEDFPSGHLANKVTSMVLSAK